MVFPFQFFHILIHQLSLSAPALWSGSHFGHIVLFLFHQFVEGNFSICGCQSILALLTESLMASGNFFLPLLSCSCS